MGVTFSNTGWGRVTGKWSREKNGMLNPTELIHDIDPALRKEIQKHFGKIYKRWTYWLDIYGPITGTIDENGLRLKDHTGGHFIMIGIVIEFFDEKDAVLFKLLGL